MDALILSCGTGGGHNSACMAIEQELTARGHQVKILNPYLLEGPKTAEAVNNAYNILVQKAPNAFGMVYRLGDAYRKLPVSSPVYHINHRMAELLEKYLTENHFDVIVATHLFPAEIITNMKRHGLPVLPSYFIATDYTCIPFTEETDCDYYVIPSEELIDEFASRGIPRERILPFGIPVGRQFLERAGQAEARARLGLDPHGKYILIAGGSIGAGQIEQVLSLLLDHYGDTVQIIAICGSNSTLHRHLEQAYHNRLLLLEYTSQMADYMRACDLFLTKPGGLSSTEAAIIGTPLIHITPIPGCETRNMAFFEERGMCYAVSSPKSQLIAACDQLFDKARQEEMKANQHRVLTAHAAASICDFIEQNQAGRMPIRA